ncbi:MAG: GTA-gp10 family protein [Pseudomonadota bacterium]
MANKEKGEIVIDASDAAFTLRFSANALCDLEAEVGASAVALANELSDEDNISITTLRAMFWAGLRDSHPDISVDDAGRIMTELGITEASAKIGEAFVAAFPASDDDGSSSGASGNDQATA